MKFVEIVLVILCISVSSIFVDMYGLIPMSSGSSDPVLGGGNYTLGPNGTIVSATFIGNDLLDELNTQSYSREGIDSTTSYLQASGDFITGLFIFVKIMVKGVVMLGPLLKVFGVPEPFQFIVKYPIWFMYLIAFFQVVFGRSIGGDK